MPTTALGAVHLPLLYTLTAPLHHGAGAAGNTSILRRQDLVEPTGDMARVPYVSGNSLRHHLRAALAWHLLRTLEVPDGSLSKAVVDLLFSGGAITHTGAQTDLEQLRRVEHLLPHLTLLGYSAGSGMTGGTVFVNHAHLVCAENAWRLPPDLAAGAHAARRAGSYQTDEFATRHDVSGTSVDRYLDLAPNTAPTTQMIYEIQVVKPGALLAGSVDLSPAATASHREALLLALDEAAPYRDGARHTCLAAKNAVGYGQATLTVNLTPLGDVATARTTRETHLRAHRDEILALLTEMVA